MDRSPFFNLHNTPNPERNTNPPKLEEKNAAVSKTPNFGFPSPKPSSIRDNFQTPLPKRSAFFPIELQERMATMPINQAEGPPLQGPGSAVETPSFLNAGGANSGFIEETLGGEHSGENQNKLEVAAKYPSVREKSSQDLRFRGWERGRGALAGDSLGMRHMEDLDACYRAINMQVDTPSGVQQIIHELYNVQGNGYSDQEEESEKYMLPVIHKADLYTENRLICTDWDDHGDDNGDEEEDEDEEEEGDNSYMHV